MKNPQHKKGEKPIVPSQASSTIMAGFLMEKTDNAGFDPSEWEDKSLPPSLKPKDFPPGAILMGKIVALNSTVIPDSGNKKGAMLVIETANGRCGLPVTAVLSRALDVEGLGTEAVSTPYIGREIMVKGTGLQPNRKKGQRDFHGFDVKIKKA